MRMYVMLAVAVLLLAVLLFFLDRALKALRTGRRRRNAAIRLAVAAAQAEDEARRQASANDASGALTTVLPSIQHPQPRPRRVA